MIAKIAEFKVKVDKLEECKKAIAEFVAAVKANEPGTILYESYQKTDSVSFIHTMYFKDAEAEEMHKNSPYVKKFVDILYPNCEIKPTFTDLKLLASNI